jgi:hypothetical protein
MGRLKFIADDNEFKTNEQNVIVLSEPGQLNKSAAKLAVGIILKEIN